MAIISNKPSYEKREERRMCRREEKMCRQEKVSYVVQIKIKRAAPYVYITKCVRKLQKVQILVQQIHDQLPQKRIHVLTHALTSNICAPL